MLVCAFREWFQRPDSRAPAWYAAYHDRGNRSRAEAAARQPAGPWTVSTLAGRVGVSRATLAKRFAELVGKPPWTYLT